MVQKNHAETPKGRGSGNVRPLSQYKVADRAYDKHNFLIHDYFFAKALDKVRPGGVVAFVTSKGTMDKKSPEVRKYLAQRAELLGAIRLPNTAFKENAGTEVTSDILFLKKRDRVIDTLPDWVYLCENEDGIAMNQYFADHPEMIMGKMEMVSGQFGMEATCTPDTAIPLSKQLEKAISHIEGSIDEVEFDELDDELAREDIPADPGVKNYSYTIVDERVYYRENSIMKPVDVSETMEQRMKGMVQIRNCTQELIDYQLNEYPEDMIKSKQAELNELYDAFSNMEEYIMQITRDNYSQYAQMVQQMFGKKASSNDPLAQCDYGNFSLRFQPVDINFTKPNWDTIMTKRDKPAMSEEEFDEAIKELARKEFATGKRDDDAYRKLCMQHGETVSPDRKAIYESSMKKTGGKMNAACMFWDSKGNKTLSYNPESRNWKAISTDEEFARARVFTSIYNDELARLKEEYGEKAKGNVSYSKIKVDISAERSKEKNNNEGNTIDLQI